MLSIKTFSQKYFLGALIIVFIVKELFLATLIPPTQAPDEQGHISYVVDLANGSLPVLGKATMTINLPLQNESALAEVPESNLQGLDQLNYIAQHPPLYYLILLPFYAIAPGADTAMLIFFLRLSSIVLGALTLFFSAKILDFIGPQRKWFNRTVVAGIAFLPMFSFMSAVVNNDNLVATLSVILLFQFLKNGQKNLWWAVRIGSIFGFLAMTKYTALPIILVVVLFQVGYFLKEKDRTLKINILKNTAVMIGVATLIAGWWYIRNKIIFKSFFPDLKQVISLDPAILGHYSYLGIIFPELKGTADPQLGWWTFLFERGFLVEYYKALWGSFGQFALAKIQYVFIFFLSGLSVVGLGIKSFSVKNKNINRENNISFKPFFGIIIGITFAIISWKLFEIARDRGFLGAMHGRYFFPAILPFFYFFVKGIENLFSGKWAKKVFLILIFTFMINDMVTIFKVLFPHFVV